MTRSSHADCCEVTFYLCSNITSLIPYCCASGAAALATAVSEDPVDVQFMLDTAKSAHLLPELTQQAGQEGGSRKKCGRG